MRMIMYNILFLLTIWSVSLVAGEMDNYPTPPPGVHWGWQGEVLFDYDSAKLLNEYKSVLLQLANTLKRFPDISVLITGRADNTGNVEHNRQLSLKRIRTISSFLTKQGIEANRIHSQNLGEQRPISINACSNDRPRNRRTDLAFFPTGSPPPLTHAPSISDTQPMPGECEEIETELDKLKGGR